MLNKGLCYCDGCGKLIPHRKTPITSKLFPNCHFCCSLCWMGYDEKNTKYIKKKLKQTELKNEKN